MNSFSRKALKIVNKINKHEKLVKFAGLILIFLLSALIIKFGDRLKDLETYGYAGIFAINLLGNATVIFPAPTFISAFIGGALFNPLLVGIAAGTGAAIGESTGYLVGLAGKSSLKNHGKYKRLRGWITTHGPLTIFFLALIPNPLFDLAGIVSGMVGLPFYQFLSFTILGKTLRFIAVSFLGAASYGWFSGF